jgi:hypothetical protein
MKNNLRLGLVSLGILFFGSFAQAAMSGVFMVVKGEVKVIAKSGPSQAAKVGTKVSEGDTIESGPESRAKIVMQDKNVFNISPDSRLVIEKYQNDQSGKNVELKVDFGKVRASVEQKYDGDKFQFNIKTPTAVAGVRGTDFITSYNPTTRVSEILTFSGMVAVGRIGGGAPVYVAPGHMTQVKDGQAPETPKTVPTRQLQQMNSESRSEARQPTPDAAAPASTTASSDSNSSDSRQPASTTGAAPAPAPTGPSMVDPSDLGTSVSTGVNVRGPASTPGGNSPVVIAPPPPPPPPPPKPPVIPGGKTRLSVIISAPTG